MSDCLYWGGLKPFAFRQEKKRDQLPSVINNLTVRKRKRTNFINFRWREVLEGGESKLSGKTFAVNFLKFCLWKFGWFGVISEKEKQETKK